MSGPTIEAARAGVAWWEGAGGAVLAAFFGAIIGSCIPLFWSWRMRRVERRGEIIAMAVEMYHARINMNDLLVGDSDVLAPLYQLPLTMVERALPKLIGEGLLEDNEISGLVEYVMRAQELNRSLQRAGDAAARDQLDQVNLRLEYDRSRTRVSHIVDERRERLGGATLFEAAEAALYRLVGGQIPGVSRG